MLAIHRSPPVLLSLLAALAALSSLTACGRTATDPASPAPTAASAAVHKGAADKADADKADADKADADKQGDAKDAADRQVKLGPDDAAKMGIVTVRATAAQFTPETAGYAVIVGHDAVAQVVADLGTAEAMSKQSHAALMRLEHLQGTVGAETAETREAAQRQASSDEIAVALAHRKLSSLLGQHSPWTQGNDATLQEVASGRTKLVRVTFALGAIQQTPHSLRLARLDGPTVEEQWHTHTVWAAPADATMPGRSFLALLPDAVVEEGERLNAWAPVEVANAESGAWVPGSAAIAEGGRYWCYVEHEAGTFERIPLDIGHPLRNGYFVNDLKPGDSVVTVGAGLLLARELNPDTGPAD
ncbi:MAG: hypothetical protein WB646_08970 [Steroidobacteraceae bacterium]